MSSDCGYLKESCPQMPNYLSLKLTCARPPSLALGRVVQDTLKGMTVREGAQLVLPSCSLFPPSLSADTCVRAVTRPAAAESVFTFLALT